MLIGGQTLAGVMANSATDIECTYEMQMANA